MGEEREGVSKMSHRFLTVGCFMVTITRDGDSEKGPGLGENDLTLYSASKEAKNWRS